MRRFFLSGFCAVAFAAFFVCGPKPVSVADMGGSEVVGKLVDSTNKPVASASVVVKRAADTVHNVRTVTSRTDGTFSIDTLPLDTYNLFATGTVNGRQVVAFIPVKVDSSAPRGEPPVVIQTGTHVMRPPGSIAGRVVLSYADPGSMAGIFVYIPGTSYIAMTNDTGGFIISNVPPDTYKIYYKSTGFPAYNPMVDSPVVVISDFITHQALKTLDLNPNETPIPVPRGIAASYDTVRGIDTLRWRKMPLSDLKEYVVVRKNKGAARSDTIRVLARDTVWLDTVFGYNSTDTTTVTRVYQVGAVDSNNNVSSLSEPPIESVAQPPSGRPRAVQIVSADSTDSSVTLRWNRSSDVNFTQYHVYRRELGAQTGSLIHLSTVISDTSYTFPTWSTTTGEYWVAVLNATGLVMAGTPVPKAIRNTPPKFITTRDSLPDSVFAGTTYNFTLQAFDRNGDSLRFDARQTAGVTIDGASLSWVPDIKQAGMQRCTLTVRDDYGGLDSFVWQPVVVVHGVWTDLDRDTLLLGRVYFGVAVAGGSIYAMGGYVNFFNMVTQPKATKTVERYDSAKCAWLTVAPLSVARLVPFVAAAANGNMYAIGGFSESNSDIRSIEQYNPSSNAWTTVGQMPFSRSNGATCAIGNRIYCIGGRAYAPSSRTQLVVKSIDIYDAAAKSWSKGPDMAIPRSDMQAVVVGGKIYIFGGEGGQADSTDAGNADSIKVLASIEVYDPVAGTCNSVATTLMEPRCYFGAAVYNGAVFITGGFTDLRQTLSASLEKFDPTTLRVSSTDGNAQLFGYQAAALGKGIYCIGGAVPAGNNTFIIKNRTAVFYP